MIIYDFTTNILLSMTPLVVAALVMLLLIGDVE